MKTFLVILAGIVAIVAADFDDHLMEEENLMLGLDPDGVPLDDIEEMDLIDDNDENDDEEEEEDDNEGSGKPENNICKEKYHKCKRDWFKKFFGICKRQLKTCCMKEFHECRTKSTSLLAFTNCNKKMLKCKNH
ncbi:uncharacterized protein LOC130654667 [Hydractinia symbiolongicarpus]|uniref:uncharacterized protein LOC130654667 n=1 Tax=Hydractinia symbiolongicarpus TaxID=13093 RepID=UPI00254B698F|nr:uncharacterized protein LOC130654667 [Hydractinia symbiolongicarpus]